MSNKGDLAKTSKERIELTREPNNILKELEKAIKTGKIKIDWIEDCEDYNEETDIRGLYTDNFYLSLFWTDKSETTELFRLFPSRKERKEKKPSSWRKDKWWTEKLNNENKIFEEKEIELIKDSRK